MMAEVINTTANKVIVVGMLDTMLVRDQNARRDKATGRAKMVEVTKKVGRDRGRGGRWENLTLQVRSPYGGMFALPIAIEPDVLGAEFLEHAEAETMLAIEGSLQLKQIFDPRFATDQLDTRNHTDRGRPTRELHLRVSCVREPNEQERRASSAVWIEGVVAEPPQISRHPDLPSIQLAGTIVRVTFGRPSDFPGSQATIEETVDVNVAIPTSHRDAEKLYRQGNVVRVVGQLDCRMEYQGGQSVTTKLAEIDAQWAERRVELVDKPGELRRAEATYRNLRQRYEAAPRRYVLAGYAELVEGETLALEDTFQARREFVRARRQQQEARRARTSSDKAQRAEIPRHVLAERIGDMPMLAGVNDSETDIADDTSRQVKPRRHVRATTIESITEPADVPVNDSDVGT